MSEAYKYRYPENYYAAEVPNTHGLKILDSTEVKPEVILGFWPMWSGKTWKQVEDHRKRVAGGKLVPIPAQEATEYWLPGDTYTTPPRAMVTLGPLPADALLVRPEMTQEEKATQARAQRDGLIAQTDYLMVSDYPISDAYRQVISDYRQTLRDITTQAGFPDEIAWPEKPARIS